MSEPPRPLEATPLGELAVAELASAELDAELAALLLLLTEHGVPLVVASLDRAAAQRIRAAYAHAVRGQQPALDALPGGVVMGESLEDVLRLSGAGLDGQSGTALPDAARDLGVVLVLGAGRVRSAHYLRPVERDGAGHLQRRPPALLAAWNDERNVLDHFWWSITTELASRVGLERSAFEDEHSRRAERLSGGRGPIGGSVVGSPTWH